VEKPYQIEGEKVSRNKYSNKSKRGGRRAEVCYDQASF